ncbi:MAG TPA: histidine phosphatase family protein, partial [Polyangiales bacterium]|nr:histidine phosphatase family protein [Polyangiales bacterium]
GELGAPDIETAPAFSERVIGALEEIVRREGEGRQVAIVTSNGVIGRLLLHVTEERDAERHGPTQRLMNSSRSLVSVDSGKLAVVAKNLVDHLPNADLHTFI